MSTFLYTLTKDSKKGGDGMAYDAQREATARYNRKTYERVELRVKKGQRELIKKAAEERGKSLNRFVLDLIAKELERDDI